MRAAAERRVLAAGTALLHAALAALLARCVSTEAGEGGLGEACVAAAPGSASEAVVVVRAELQPGVLRCSGVAITRTLVVTALACVVRPEAVGDPDELGTEPGPPSVFDPSVPYADICQTAGDWAPLEDGTFSSSLGKPVPASDLSVYRQGGMAVAVDRVAMSGAVSRCTDGLAILSLQRELDVTAALVRLTETSQVNEPVILSGHCRSGDVPVRRDVSSNVEGIRFDSGDTLAPPRSLALRQSTSTFDFGGAVVSETGALIAILSSGFDESCEAQDPNGTSIALRLAPFRRMLLDAAANTGQTLRVEAGPDSAAALQLQPCPRPATSP